MPPKPRFLKGEKILCINGPLTYKVKCLQVIITEDGYVKYLVHYLGLPKRQDEWVLEDRLMKCNKKNFIKQREQRRAYRKRIKHNKSSPSGRSVQYEKVSSPSCAPSTSWAIAKNESPKQVPPEVEIKSDSTTGASTSTISNGAPVRSVKYEQMNTPSSAPSTSLAIATTESPKQVHTKVDIKLSDELKDLLVDDWHSIRKQEKLVNIPAKLTVDDIFNNYVAYKKSANDNNAYKESAAIEITNGIKDYFNTVLQTKLLYKFEQPQHAAIFQQHPDTPMSKIYGARHLLRLFVKLGDMLAYTPMEERSIQLLQTNIQDFLKYMAENTTTLFSSEDYDNAPLPYLLKDLLCEESIDDFKSEINLDIMFN